jgi:hypothetical protein
MQIFLDSDGVLADFDRHVMEFSGGKTPRQLGNDALWELVNSISDFWLTMPLMPGANDLMEFSLPHNPIILTGCPRTGYDVASTQKPIKLGRYFPGVPVITCLSKEKPLHMKAPGDILVDDMVHNVKRWRNAGGTAILYKSADQAISELRNALRTRL